MPGWLSWLERTAHRVLSNALTYSWDTVRSRVRIPPPALHQKRFFSIKSYLEGMGPYTVHYILILPEITHPDYIKCYHHP